MIINGALAHKHISLQEVIHHLHEFCDGGQLSYHASANAIDFNRLVSAFPRQLAAPVAEEVEEIEFESDYESEDEEEDAPEEEEYEDTVVAAPVVDWSRNPLPPKDKWINTVIISTLLTKLHRAMTSSATPLASKVSSALQTTRYASIFHP